MITFILLLPLPVLMSCLFDLYLFLCLDLNTFVLPLDSLSVSLSVFYLLFVSFSLMSLISWFLSFLSFFVHVSLIIYFLSLSRHWEVHKTEEMKTCLKSRRQWWTSSRPSFQWWHISFFSSFSCVRMRWGFLSHRNLCPAQEIRFCHFLWLSLSLLCHDRDSKKEEGGKKFQERLLPSKTTMS